MDISHVLTHFVERIFEGFDFLIEFTRLSDRHLVQISLGENNNHFTNRYAGSSRYAGENGV